MYRVPGGYPGGSPQFAFSRKTPHTAPPKKLAPAAAPGRSAYGRSAPRPVRVLLEELQEEVRRGVEEHELEHGEDAVKEVAEAGRHHRLEMF